MNSLRCNPRGCECPRRLLLVREESIEIERTFFFAVSQSVKKMSDARAARSVIAGDSTQHVSGKREALFLFDLEERDAGRNAIRGVEMMPLIGDSMQVEEKLAQAG